MFIMLQEAELERIECSRLYSVWLEF